MKTYNELAAQTWQKISRRKTAKATFYKRLITAVVIVTICVFLPTGAYFLSDHTPFQSTPTAPPISTPVSPPTSEPPQENPTP